MLPRFINKTHTDALRPNNFSLLVSRCSSPDQRLPPETMAIRLQDWLDKSVAKFTVLLAGKKNRGFGFLTDNMIWSWKGHVVNTAFTESGKDLHAPDLHRAPLSVVEQICYLRYYIETEGAIFLKLAKLYRESGMLSYLLLKNHIQDIFLEIIDDYMDIAEDFRSRSRISEIRNQMKRDSRYDPGTLPHKIRPHLQALVDLGLLAQEGETYLSTGRGHTEAMSRLVEELVDMATMEARFERYDYFSIVSNVLDLSPRQFDAYRDRDLMLEVIALAYERMRSPITRMADLDAILDWCSVKLLADHRILVRKSDGEEFFRMLRMEAPGKITYHLDGTGRIAYLVVNGEL